jgi:hypothetical protein
MRDVAGNGIETGSATGTAAAQPADSQNSAREQAVAMDRFIGVARTAWFEAARWPEHRQQYR